MLCFLPVWFSWIRSKVAKPSPSIQLDATADEEQEAITPSKLAPAPQPLTGWKILLLWIPALCDLTGTTARVHLIFAISIHLSQIHYSS